MQMLINEVVLKHPRSLKVQK